MDITASVAFGTYMRLADFPSDQVATDYVVERFLKDWDELGYSYIGGYEEAERIVVFVNQTLVSAYDDHLTPLEIKGHEVTQPALDQLEAFCKQYKLKH